MTGREPKIRGKTLWDVLREWQEFSASSNLWLIVRRLERLEQKWRQQAELANQDAPQTMEETIKTILMEQCRVKAEDADELSAIVGNEKPDDQ